MSTTQTYNFTKIDVYNQKSEIVQIEVELIESMTSFLWNDVYIIRFKIKEDVFFLSSPLKNGLVECKTKEDAQLYIEDLQEAFEILQDKYNCFLRGERYDFKGEKEFLRRQSTEYHEEKLKEFERRNNL